MEKKEGMTAKDLYDYIMQHMTPEQAVMKFLEAGLIKYEKLKFNEGEEIHPIILISMAAMDLGWDFLIENENTSKNVRGVSVGTKDYFDALLIRNRNE